MDLKETYNRIAEDWVNEHKTDTWWTPGTDAFCGFLKPGATILDVGCAGGTKTKYLAARGFAVTGIDFAEKLIEIARRAVLEAEFLIRDIRDLPRLGQAFDAVFAQAVLLHVPRREAGEAVKTLAGTLSPGGHLYVAVKEARPGEPEEGILKEDDYGYPFERFFSYFTMDEIQGFFRDAGLVIRYDTIEQSGKTRWITVIGQRP